MKTKKSRFDFEEMKRSNNKVTWVTAYDYPTASFAEQAGIDMILVGDSLGMCVYGYEGTIPVTMDQCIEHCKAVRRGAPNTFVVGDMPFMSYQVSSDLLGVFQAFTPKFVKKYENLAERSIEAFAKYDQEVRNAEFPEEQHTYKMIDGEYGKLLALLRS
jgi:ketopantoate hydroxymethyltransferase